MMSTDSVKPVKCRLCGEAIECRPGLDEMEDHWSERHFVALNKLKDWSADSFDRHRLPIAREAIEPDKMTLREQLGKPETEED